jgi:hypothetical protein
MKYCKSADIDMIEPRQSHTERMTHHLEIQPLDYKKLVRRFLISFHHANVLPC